MHRVNTSTLSKATEAMIAIPTLFSGVSAQLVLYCPGRSMDTWGASTKQGFGGALENFKVLKNFD